MDKTLWRNLFFTFAAFTFVCLLLGGGSRLIASPEMNAGPILSQDNLLNASLTCPPAAQQYGLSEQKGQENRQTADDFVCFEQYETERIIVQTDANGNVLRHASYMRTVYQAFALGDGFA